MDTTYLDQRVIEIIRRKRIIIVMMDGHSRVQPVLQVIKHSVMHIIHAHQEVH